MGQAPGIWQERPPGSLAAALLTLSQRCPGWHREVFFEGTPKITREPSQEKCENDMRVRGRYLGHYFIPNGILNLVKIPQVTRNYGPCQLK